MEYFGTDLRSPGHYFFKLEDGFSKNNTHFKDLPFNPEAFFSSPYYGKVGDTAFLKTGGYTVFAVNGSPADNRLGCKSVFFVKENLSHAEMLLLIRTNPVAYGIIKAIPAEVNF